MPIEYLAVVILRSLVEVAGYLMIWLWLALVYAKRAISRHAAAAVRAVNAA